MSIDRRSCAKMRCIVFPFVDRSKRAKHIPPVDRHKLLFLPESALLTVASFYLVYVELIYPFRYHK